MCKEIYKKIWEEYIYIRKRNNYIRDLQRDTNIKIYEEYTNLQGVIQRKNI